MDAEVQKQLKILILEDVPADAELIERTLRKGGLRFAARRVDTREKFDRALDQFRPDIVLSDYKLPDFDGLAALKLARSRYPDVPVIEVTGALGDEAALELVRAGAHDYVLKDRLARLPYAVQDALSHAEELRGRKLAEQAVRRSEEQYRGIVESAQDGIIGKDLNGVVTSWNKGAERIYGYTAAEIVGRPVNILAPPERKDEVAELIAKVARGERVGLLETQRITKAGRLVEVAITLSPIWDSAGEIVGISTVARDIAERKRAERERAFNAAVMSAIQQTSPDGILLVDTNGQVVARNQRFLDLWAIPPALAASKSDEPLLKLRAGTGRRARCVPPPSQGTVCASRRDEP